MNLNLATVLLLLLLIQDLGDIDFLLAAGVLVVRAHGSIECHLHFRRLLMEMAVAHF